MPSIRQRLTRASRTDVIIHILIICIIFFLPEMLQQYGRPRRPGLWEWWPYIKAVAYVAIFYLNYSLIINRTLFSKPRHLWTFFGCNLLLVAVVFTLNYLMQRYWMMHVDRPRPWLRDLPPLVLMLRGWSFYLREFGMVVLTVALSVAMKFARKWNSMEKKHQEMRSIQRAAELESLKAQLNPHFLFNTLNTIYSLIEISPREAQDAVHKLSKLLRYMLYENPGMVHLSQEIEFARTYISLMEMRIGDGVVRYDFDSVTNDVMVAPLLLFTLVENACKHGNTGAPGATIDVFVTSDADGVVTFSTRNHFIAKEESDRGHVGIGLANLRRRLSLLYGENATLDTSVEDDVYTAILTIDTNK